MTHEAFRQSARRAGSAAGQRGQFNLPHGTAVDREGKCWWISCEPAWQELESACQKHGARSGITAIIHHRLAHALQVLGAPLAARIIAEIAHSTTRLTFLPRRGGKEVLSSITAPAW